MLCRAFSYPSGIIDSAIMANNAPAANPSIIEVCSLAIYCEIRNPIIVDTATTRKTYVQILRTQSSLQVSTDLPI